VWARLVYGAQVSMAVGLIASTIAVVIGTAVGLIAGYVGGSFDNVLMRFTELVMTFPAFFAVITLVSLVGPNIFNVMVVIGVLGWPGLARLVRGQVLSLRSLAFVEAAQAVGASPARILITHILPNVLPYVLIAATLGMAGAILTEAGLSFLGLGVQIPVASWGTMINSAQSLIVLERQPWLWLPPGIAISLAVLALNFVGDGMRDAFDPRMSL
jgi:peptide/nickel transport system permease protein